MRLILRALQPSPEANIRLLGPLLEASPWSSQQMGEGLENPHHTNLLQFLQTSASTPLDWCGLWQSPDKGVGDAWVQRVHRSAGTLAVPWRW